VHLGRRIVVAVAKNCSPKIVGKFPEVGIFMLQDATGFYVESVLHRGRPNHFNDKLRHDCVPLSVRGAPVADCPLTLARVEFCRVARSATSVLSIDSCIYMG
jgi:hypothetical protein